MYSVEAGAHCVRKSVGRARRMMGFVTRTSGGFGNDRVWSLSWKSTESFWEDHKDLCWQRNSSERKVQTEAGRKGILLSLILSSSGWTPSRVHLLRVDPSLRSFFDLLFRFSVLSPFHFPRIFVSRITLLFRSLSNLPSSRATSSSAPQSQYVFFALRLQQLKSWPFKQFVLAPFPDFPSL